MIRFFRNLYLWFAHQFDCRVWKEIAFPEFISPEDFRNLELTAARKWIPDALAFREALHPDLNPSDVVLITGGDKLPSPGYTEICWRQLEKLSHFNGYNLLHIATIPLARPLRYKSRPFTAYWQKIFAFPQIRTKYPQAKYFAWLDNDVLTMYPQTNMLNHFLNLLHTDEKAKVLFVEDCDIRPLNGGLFLFKNCDWIFDLFTKAMDVALERNGYLTKNEFYEQDAITILRNRESIVQEILIVPKRQGSYNMNTHFYDTLFGDAFLHMAGMKNAARHRQAKKLQVKTEAIVNLVLSRFSQLPISANALTPLNASNP